MNLKWRELIALVRIASLGGCENQLKAHINANITVGNDCEKLIEVITQCIPYIGFPRSLNAINCINEIIKEKEV
ncbi:MAG: carboxymuconolactone decarboxylase family protein [Beduini sp.]